jgi:hypothetical protein
LNSNAELAYLKKTEWNEGLRIVLKYIAARKFTHPSLGVTKFINNGTYKKHVFRDLRIYIARKKLGKTYEAIGTKHGLSKDRVRNIIEKQERQINWLKETKPKSKEELLREIIALRSEVDSLNKQNRHLEWDLNEHKRNVGFYKWKEVKLNDVSSAISLINADESLNTVERLRDSIRDLFLFYSSNADTERAGAYQRILMRRGGHL